MSLEGWKTTFEIIGVALLFFSFLAGAGALIFSNKVNAVKDEQLRQFDKELTDAKSALGRQTADMAKQQTRAATAERELLELREHIKPRKLTDQQSAAFVSALKMFPNGEVKLGYTAGSADEGFNLAKQIQPLFIQAGWKAPKDTSGMNVHLEIQVTGVAVLIRVPVNPKLLPGQIVVTPLLEALKSAFKAVGMDLQFMNYHPEKGDIPEVVIGSKPDSTNPN